MKGFSPPLIEIYTPQDCLKLSALVHPLEPLTLLPATVVCISVKCDARTVAGGESQLSVVIANQRLSDFSEDGSDRSSCYEINFVMESRRTLRFGCSGKFVICRGYVVVKEPAHGTGLNCYRPMRRRYFTVPSLYTSLFVEK